MTVPIINLNQITLENLLILKEKRVSVTLYTEMSLLNKQMIK
jgi:hypothetical protein